MPDNDFSERAEAIVAERSMGEREAWAEWARMEDFAKANGLFLCGVRASDEQGRLIQLGPLDRLEHDEARRGGVGRYASSRGSIGP